VTLTLNQAHNAINQSVTTALTGQVTTVLYDNVALTAAQQGLIDGSGTPLGSWVRVTIKDNLRSQRTLGATLGQRIFENAGIVICQVFTPSGDGRVESDRICDLLLGCFSPVNGLDPWYRNAVVMPIGSSGLFWQTNVSAEFFWDELR
jgi:hypothetical protein